MQRVFITGAGRGIGLALARQYAGRGDRVLAGCRDLGRAPGLRELIQQHADAVRVAPLDVVDPDAIAEAVRQARAAVDGLDVLINNAAINPGDAVDVLINNAAINPGDAEMAGPDGQPLLDAARIMEVLRVDAVAPLQVAQAFLPLLRAGRNPRLVNISSGAGSLACKTSGGDYSYAAAKAALNMLTRTLAFNVRDQGVTAVAIDPGWVKTDMGGPHAHLEPHQSAEGLLRVIDALTPQDAGRFLRYDGGEVPW